MDGKQLAQALYMPQALGEDRSKEPDIQTPVERFEVLDAKLDDLREQLREIRAIVRRIENQASL